MFTGIVIESGQIRSCEPSGGGVDLAVEAPEIAAGARIGDSVAVDGLLSHRGRAATARSSSSTRSPRRCGARRSAGSRPAIG